MRTTREAVAQREQGSEELQLRLLLLVFGKSLGSNSSCTRKAAAAFSLDSLVTELSESVPLIFLNSSGDGVSTTIHKDSLRSRET